VKLVVTGGAGFIGSNFIRHVLAAHADDSIVNLDKLTYAGNLKNLADVTDSPRYRFVHGDVCDAKMVRDVLRGADAVVNFAAESHVDRSLVEPDAFLRTDVFGVFTLLEAVRELSIPRLVHISTDEVYGSLATGSARESDPLRPSNPYSASKAGGDLLALAYWQTHRVPVVVTRSSNNFGPFQYPEKLIPLVIRNALVGEPLPVYGDGRNLRDWLYVADHCEAVRLVLEKGRVGETYNIGGENERANIDVVRTICAVLERLRPPPAGSYAQLIRHVTDRLGHDRRYAMNIAKIRRELGWRPRESFESGLEKTVRWYLDNLERHFAAAAS